MREAHLGDVLSALVDGELADDEEAAARRHLDECGDCRDELAATESIARTVRGLPPVDPRFGFFERLTRPGGFAAGRPHRSRVRVGVAIAGIAALVAVAVGVVGDFRGALVSPPVDEMLEVHEAGLVPSGAFGNGFEEATPDDMAEPFMAPMEVGDGYRREAVYERPRDQVVAVAYRSGGDSVSVFEQDGALDADSLGTMEPMADDVWAMETDGMHAVVIDRGRLVYTVVGAAPMPTLMAVVADLPDPGPPSMWERFRGASADLVWTFSLR